MFEFGRGVVLSHERAIYYYKEGADYSSILSFHLVYGNKCSKRLGMLQANVPDPNLKIYHDRRYKNDFVENDVPLVSEGKYDVIEMVEVFSNSCSIESIEYKYAGRNPLEKSVSLRFVLKDVHFNKQWRFLKLIMNLEMLMKERIPELKGIGPMRKENKVVILFNIPSNKILMSLENFLLNEKFEKYHMNREFFIDLLEKLIRCIIGLIAIFFKNPYLTTQSFWILKGEKTSDTVVLFNYKFFYDNLEALEGEGNQYDLKNAKSHEFAFLQYVASFYKGEISLGEELISVLFSEIKTFTEGLSPSVVNQEFLEGLRSIFSNCDRENNVE